MCQLQVEELQVSNTSGPLPCPRVQFRLNRSFLSSNTPASPLDQGLGVCLELLSPRSPTAGSFSHSSFYHDCPFPSGFREPSLATESKGAVPPPPQTDRKGSLCPAPHTANLYLLQLPRQFGPSLGPTSLPCSSQVTRHRRR